MPKQPYSSQLLHLFHHEAQARTCLLIPGGDFAFDQTHRPNEGGSSSPRSAVVGPSSFSSAPATAPTWMQFLSAKAADQMDVSCGLNAAQEPSATAPYVSGVLHTYQMSGLS